ncbi:MAG: hypothetical protein PHI34_14990 [Acidobacteriota bacterium]|nr:hypothetical protein [Acidobacteriota bacterium]
MKRGAIVCVLGLFLVVLSTGLYAHQPGVIENGYQLRDAWEAYQRYMNADATHRPSMETSLQAGTFMGYVVAVYDSMRERGADVPNNLPYNEVFKMVGRFIDDRPDELNRRAFQIVRTALAEFARRR